MLQNNLVLNKVFACGVGYPVRTRDGTGMKNKPSKDARADSFSLYMNFVGDMILKSICAKAKIPKVISHFEPSKES
jgi:hypothetical protein